MMRIRTFLLAAFSAFLVSCSDEPNEVPEILGLDDLYLDITLERSITTPDYIYLDTVKSLVEEFDQYTSSKNTVGICIPGFSSIETGLVNNAN